MVSKETRMGGVVVKELDAVKYRAVAGEIRKNLPPHIVIEPERVWTKKGKTVRLWCRYPKTAKEAIEKAVGGK